MRILGIDPGSLHTGYGILEKRGSRLAVVTYGRISLRRGAPLPQRLAVLADRTEELLAAHRPQHAALESLFGGPNTRSLIVLAQARGALLTILGRHQLEIAEYAPSEIKNAVTGSGRADKIQVSRMVQMILGLQGRDIPADTSDALAAAICYAHRVRLERLKVGATASS